MAPSFRTICLLLALPACTGGEYEVVLVANSDVLADGATWELAIVRGGCTDELAEGEPPEADATVKSFSWNAGEAGPTIGDLAPGRYGFYARVRDDGCQVLWAGCTTVDAEAGGDGRVVVPIEPVDGPGCGDGLACNGDEACDPVLGCVPGDEPSCSDGIDCTIDSCAEPAGDCASVPDDGLCPGDERCDPAFGCGPGLGCVVDPDCDDGDECTEDSCEDGECAAFVVDADEDGFPCGADCDDEDPGVSPGTFEVCNGRDDDCNDTVDEGCAGDCEEVPLENGETLFVCFDPVTWSEAVDRCLSLGATLAVPTSDGEQADLAGAALFADDDCWIGANDLDEEGYWTDPFGEPLEYAAWDFDEPDGFEDENCAILVPDFGGAWADTFCEDRFPALCWTR